MKGNLDEIIHDKIIIRNTGTTTVTYEWKKVQRKDLIAAKRSDFAQRFFCHYVSALLLDVVLAEGDSQTWRKEEVHVFFQV
jgi:hypothetical protein